MIPRAYFLNWRAISGEPAGPAGNFIYCPAVTTATLARRYGVAYVLEPHGAKGPRGGVFDRTIGEEDLYRIPGAGNATLTALTPGHGLPSPDARGKTVAVTYPGPASWKLVTHSTRPAVLRLRLTDLPGWHATIDGRPLDLLPFTGVMLQARIPPGTHTIKLHYWPGSFSAGIALAVVSVLALCAVPVLAKLRRRS